VDELQHDKLDFGIVSTPLEDLSIIEEKIYTEKFKIYLNPKHPAYSKKSLTGSDLTEDKLWLLSEGNCFRTQTINLCSFNPSQYEQFALQYESGSLYTLRKIVDLEGGATILPEWECIQLTEPSKVHLRAFEDDTAAREVGLIYTKHYAKESVIQKVKEIILQSLPEEIKKNQGLRAVRFN
jgi:LysR family hydrogen peroxide-inducible transcriptional activator